MNEQDFSLNKLATDDTGIYGYVHFFLEKILNLKNIYLIMILSIYQKR